MTTSHNIAQNETRILGMTPKEATLAVIGGAFLISGLFAMGAQGQTWAATGRAITIDLNDPHFVAAAVKSGYRTEMVSHINSEPYLLARCARTNAEGPAACDPFPATNGQYRVQMAR